MKTRFSEFYTKNKLNFKNLEESVIIVFDTNTLLNIYRYSEQTKQKMIKVFGSLKKNIWIPYQVGLEFNLRRRSVIYDIESSKKNFYKELELEIASFKNKVEDKINKFPVKSVDAKDLKKMISKKFSEQIDGVMSSLNKEEINNLEKLLDHNNDGLERLAIILDGNVNQAFTQEELDKIYAEGEDRYDKRIPPGYKDRNKTDMTHYNGLTIKNKFGDLIIWKEIIEYTKKSSIIKTVVFVTDDSKEDWWYQLDNGKIIGPRAELKNELKRETNAELIMMSVNTFLENNGQSNLVAKNESYLKKLIDTNNKVLTNIEFRNKIDSFYVEDKQLVRLQKDLEEEIKDTQRLLDILINSVVKDSDIWSDRMLTVLNGFLSVKKLLSSLDDDYQYLGKYKQGEYAQAKLQFDHYKIRKNDIYNEILKKEDNVN